jgi:hypothetical protein
MIQTINSINLCINCIDKVIVELEESNEISIEGLKIYNMYLEPVPYMEEYPKEKEWLYGHLHTSCTHIGSGSRSCNIAHDQQKEITEYDVHGLLLPTKIKLTNDTRKHVLTKVANEVKMARML